VIDYQASRLICLAVVVAYGLVQVRSSVPPLIGLRARCSGGRRLKWRSATCRHSPRRSLSSHRTMPLGAASQAASLTRHEPSIGLSLLLLKRGGRVAVAERNRAEEITVKIHRGRIWVCNRWRTSSG
jgi:hypothetical protein